jgi:hypothetical protein
MGKYIARLMTPLVFLFGLSSVISLIITIWQLRSDKPDWYWYVSLLAIVVITGYVSAFIWILATEEEHKRIQEQIVDDSAQAFHKLFQQTGTWLHKTAHDIRDHVTDLEWAYTQKQLNLKELRTDALIVGEKIADYLETLFSFYLLDRIGDNKVAVSIKILERKANGQEMAKTLCRSKHSAPGRKIGDEHVIGPANTAFFEIREGKTRYFGKSDLIAEYHAQRYSNTNPNWQQQYKSAIVVPIRNKNPLYPEKSSEEFKLIGFLCADANVIGAFDGDGKRMEAYAQMLMAAGDGLFKYFEIVNSLQTKV